MIFLFMMRIMKRFDVDINQAEKREEEEVEEEEEVLGTEEEPEVVQHLDDQGAYLHNVQKLNLLKKARISHQRISMQHGGHV